MTDDPHRDRSDARRATTRPPIACVLLPELPIVAHHPVGEDDPDAPGDVQPRTVHVGQGSAARVRFADASARALGVRVGQTVAAARTRCAALSSLALDEAAMAHARREVTALLLEHTPRLAPDGPTRFWAEPAPLGDDVDAWCNIVCDALQAWGPVRIGVGAWAAVAYAAATVAGPVRVVLEPHRFLDAAPLDVLELGAEPCASLSALGVRTVGALRALDPVELGARLGPDVARARRRADGDDPRMPWTPRSERTPRVEVALEDELDALEPLLFLLRPALARLVRDPVGRGEGVTELVLTLARERGGSQSTRVRSAHPIADASTLLELVRAHLDAGPPPTGDEDARDFVIGFSITATGLAPLGDRTRALFGARGAEGAPWRDPAAREVALARLAGRFGADALRRATRIESPSPLARAGWTRDTPVPGPSAPWRAQEPPALVTRGEVELAGARRRVRRVGRVERALVPWWHTGAMRVERLAWAELDGPILALLRERRDARTPRWEVVLWID